MPGDSSRSSSDANEDPKPGAEEQSALPEVPKVVPRASMATLSLPARAGRTSRTRGRLSVLQADALKSSRAALEQRHTAILSSSVASNASNASNEDTLGATTGSATLQSFNLGLPLSQDDAQSLISEMTAARQALQLAREEADVLEVLNGEAEHGSEAEAEILALREEVASQRQTFQSEEELQERMKSEIAEAKIAEQKELSEQLELQEEAWDRECDCLRQSEQTQKDLREEVIAKAAEISVLEMRGRVEAEAEEQQRSAAAEAQLKAEQLQSELKAAESHHLRLAEEVMHMKDAANETESCRASLVEETEASKEKAEAVSELRSELRSALSETRELSELQELSAQLSAELSECGRSLGQERAQALSEVELLQKEVQEQRCEQEDLREKLSEEHQRSAVLAQAEHRLQAALQNQEVRERSFESKREEHPELSEQMASLRQQELDLRRAIAAHRYVVRNSMALPPPPPAQPIVEHESSAGSGEESPAEDEIGSTVRLSSRVSTSDCQDFLFGLRRSGMSGSTIAWLHGAT